MATVIDQLTVTLGLDPKDFVEGQKKAGEAFLKTRKQAQEEGKKVETAAQGMSDGIAAVTRRVLELYALFLGGKGLKEFVSGLVAGDAALGRFSANLGISPQLVSEWQLAVQRIGGSASDAAATLTNLAQTLYDAKFNGKGLPLEFFQLQEASGMQIATDKGLPAYANSLAAALKKLYATDPSRAHILGGKLGVDDNDFNLMVKYGGEFSKYLDSLKNLTPSNDAIKAAQQLQASWATLEQQATSLGNALLATLGPQIANILQQMTDWISKNHDWLMSNIVDSVQQFAHWLASIDWKAVGDGLTAFGNGAIAVANSIGGIETATEALFALWLGPKFYAVLARAGLLGAALGGGGGATAAAEGAAGGGFLAMLGEFIPWVAAAAVTGTVIYHQMNQPAGGGNFGDVYTGLAKAAGSLFNRATPNLNGSASQKALAQETFDFWKKAGYTDIEALAMVGSEYGESKFDVTATGDNGHSHGIYQHSEARRQQILAATGIDVGDPNTTHLQQLQAKLWENQHGDSGARYVYDSFLSPALAPDTLGAAVALQVSKDERSADQAGDTVKRTGYAKYWGSVLDLTGAKSAAAINQGAGRNVQISHGIQIGTMIVNSAATNAAGIAGDIHGALQNQKTTASSNNGLF